MDLIGWTISGIGAVLSALGLRRKDASQSQTAKADRGGSVAQTQVGRDANAPVISVSGGTVNVAGADPAVIERVFEHEGRIVKLETQFAQFMDGIPQLAPDNPVRRASESARALLKEYRWAEAARAAEVGLRLRTTPGERAALYNLLGQARYRPGELAGAEAAWREMLREVEAIPEPRERAAARAAALGNIGIVLRAKGDLDGTLKHYNEALELYKRLGSLEGQANQLGNIGVVLRIKGDLNGALKRYNEALDLHKTRGSLEGQAADLGNIGNVLLTKGDLEGALRQYNEALELEKRLGSLEGQAKALGNIGVVLKTKGDLEGALKHYKDALELAKRLESLEGQANQLGNIGVVLAKKGDLEGALKHYKDALELHKRLGSLERQAIQLGNIGVVLAKKGDLEGALKHFNEALDLDKGLGRLEGQAIRLGNIGNVLRIKGDLEGALSRYNEALELYERMGAGRSQDAEIVRGNIARVEEQRRAKG